MFRFLFAWRPGDDFAPLAADGFVGVESDEPPPDGVPVAGGRWAGDTPAAGQGIAGDVVRVVNGFGYGVLPAGDDRPAHAVGRDLRRSIDRAPDAYGRDRHRLLVENGGAFQTASALWTVIEAADHPAVGVALDLAAARAAGQSAAVLVPTLNLRIGLVRVRGGQDDLADYARRLAGIGFDGYVVADPPAGPDRPAAALMVAAVFRGVLPSKPVKKPPPPRPAARPAATPSE